ncbi:DUF6772 family protein [Muricoccus radiodurans]|uniref:DUF6772 family protein n=1 Tax=Muricoccus radiodurans TaxID=2231721 RepID=UPI003CE6DBF4
MSTDADAIRRALQLADPRLSRFDPLPRIISFDDFDEGFCGWTQLVGNYEHTLDAMLPGYAQHTQSMLSSCIAWEFGSHGAADGTYSLKVATRPRKGAQNVTVKRLTFRRRGPIRWEFYFTFKPEANELRLSETDVRSFGFGYDLQTGDGDGNGARVMPHFRFLNARDGEHVQRWQFKPETTPIIPIGNEGKTISHYHLAPEGWVDLPGGEQKLCYNEIPTKVNWHYVCFDFDLETMRATGFRCNDRVFDLSAYEPIRMPAMRNLWCMLNLFMFAETDTDKRAFLYVDSVCLSGDF